MAQPQIRRNTWDGPPGGRSVVDARATELLHVYIYDYCKKHNFHQAARSFAAEANISTDQQPPIDIATGFLADWWGVFWDVYHAKNKDAQATKEAGIHDEYHELLRNRKEEVLQQQRNFSMQQAVQQQQQRRASEVQRLAQSPQLQHPLHGQQDPQQQQQQQSQQQQPHVPSQQQQTQQQQQGQSRDHRPSPASSTASLPNSGGVPPQNNNNVNSNNNNNNANPGNANPNPMVNTPQTLSASLPQQQQQQQQQQHPGNRLGAPSPSFSPQQMQRPGAGNPTGNESVPGHPEGMMNSPMVNAQGIPMNAQGQMMMNQRPNIGAPNAIIQNTMNAMGFGGRDPHSLTQEERTAVQMQVRKQTMYMNQPGMMRNPNMMVNSQAQSRLQQQLMMNHQMYQQQQQQMQQGQIQPGQPQHQMQQGQPQTSQQAGQPQPHQPGQPSIPSQQNAGPQPNPQAHPQSGAQPQQPQPPQQGQPGPHPASNNQTGNGVRPPGAMVPGSGALASSGPGQMAGNMQNPNMMSGQFGGGEAMNVMLAQQMLKNGQMAGMTPQQQQQHQQQQQFLAQQQHQRLLFNQRRMQQQHQQMANQSGQTPPNPNMGSPNPPAPMNAGSPQDDKGRTPLALYQRRQMHYIMQQQHQDQQRQQYVQQQHGQTPPQQQPGHPPKRQRPNPDGDNPNGGANQSPQMGMASPQVMNAAQTPQNTNNIPGSSQASPVMSMQQRLSQQQHQQTSFNQDPNAKPSQSPQMNRNMTKPNQTPQQVSQQLPIQGPSNASQQGMSARMGWNPGSQGGEMQSPGMIEGDQSPAVTPGGGMMNNGPVPSNNMMSFDLERFMMSDGGDFGEIFTAGDDSGEQNLLMGGDNNEMFGGGFLASMGGGFGGDANSAMGGMDNATSLQLYSELTGHDNKVSTVAFSVDGQWLASAGHDKKVLIWAVHDKLLRWTLVGHTSQITCARWSPDQRHLLVTSSYDKSLRVWDLGQAMKDGTEVKEIAKFECKAQITAVDFAPDRPDTICSLDAEGELNVWHIPSSKSEKTIKMAASKSLFATNPLRFHPRLGKILACAAGNQLFVIDIDMVKNNASSADTAAVRTINADHSKNICSLDWSADGTYLVASSENAVMVYETGQWKLVNRHTATDKISACAFVMPTNTNGGGDSSTGGVTGPEKLRVVYGSYESIYVWQCSVSGSQPKRAGAQSGMVTGLACTNNTNGQTIVASASHYKEKNLMLWTL